MCQINIVYTLKLHSVICQLYLYKKGLKRVEELKEQKQEMLNLEEI